MYSDEEATYYGGGGVAASRAAAGGGENNSNDPLALDDAETWMDHWSEELVTLWHGLQEHAQMMGAAVLDRCDFPAFAQFCWERSSRRPPVV